MIEFKTYVSGDDFCQAMLLHTSFHRTTKVILGFLAVGLFVSAILLYLRGSGIGILLFIIVLGYIIRHLVVRNIFLPEASLRAYAQQKALHTSQKIIFTEEGISISSQQGRNNVSWQQIIKCRQSKQYLLIYQAKDQFIILPKQDMIDKNKWQDLINLLERKQILTT